MLKNPKVVEGKTPNFKKLMEYGFCKNGEDYVFCTGILGGQFDIEVWVTSEGDTKLKVMDGDTDEEYAVVYAQNSTGGFVGSVRSACEKVMQEIAGKCYEHNSFLYEQANEVVEYIKNRYNAPAEFLWDRLPTAAAFRNQKSGKWFAVIQSIERKNSALMVRGLLTF